MLFDGANREQVAAFGEVRRPSIADLFVAIMSRELATASPSSGGQGAGSGEQTEIRGQKSEVRETK